MYEELRDRWAAKKIFEAMFKNVRDRNDKYYHYFLKIFLKEFNNGYEKCKKVFEIINTPLSSDDISVGNNAFPGGGLEPSTMNALSQVLYHCEYGDNFLSRAKKYEKYGKMGQK